ncbi:MAG: hypothetical protein LC749_08285, partial [Actinobacteria bacterium]|nr:hypothetical protein [Actinomycetota bacterium]
VEEGEVIVAEGMTVHNGLEKINVSSITGGTLRPRLRFRHPHEEGEDEGAGEMAPDGWPEKKRSRRIVLRDPRCSDAQPGRARLPPAT